MHDYIYPELVEGREGPVLGGDREVLQILRRDTPFDTIVMHDIHLDLGTQRNSSKLFVLSVWINLYILKWTSFSLQKSIISFVKKETSCLGIIHGYFSSGGFSCHAVLCSFLHVAVTGIIFLLFCSSNWSEQEHITVTCKFIQTNELLFMHQLSYLQLVYDNPNGSSN